MKIRSSLLCTSPTIKNALLVSLLSTMPYHWYIICSLSEFIYQCYNFSEVMKHFQEYMNSLIYYTLCLKYWVAMHAQCTWIYQLRSWWVKILTPPFKFSLIHADMEEIVIQILRMLYQWTEKLSDSTHMVKCIASAFSLWEYVCSTCTSDTVPPKFLRIQLWIGGEGVQLLLN